MERQRAAPLLHWRQMVYQSAAVQLGNSGATPAACPHLLPRLKASRSRASDLGLLRTGRPLPSMRLPRSRYACVFMCVYMCVCTCVCASLCGSPRCILCPAIPGGASGGWMAPESALPSFPFCATLDTHTHPSGVPCSAPLFHPRPCCTMPPIPKQGSPSPFVPSQACADALLDVPGPHAQTPAPAQAGHVTPAPCHAAPAGAWAVLYHCSFSPGASQASDQATPLPQPQAVTYPLKPLACPWWVGGWVWLGHWWGRGRAGKGI